jgi:tRNA-splicing ligase RtcB
MISGKILKQYGWPEGRVMGAAKAAVDALEAGGLTREQALARIDQVRTDPDTYSDDPLLDRLATEVKRTIRAPVAPEEPALASEPVHYDVWGQEGIDAAALGQMDAAMRLPVTVAGALMADAHVGYGLPIGGVLATQDAVIPYAVGVDIACRMRLSVYPIGPEVLRERPEQFERALLARTQFGAGAAWRGKDRAEHEVLDDAGWHATKLLRSLQDKAQAQLGTSGTGNHFVEWGIFRLSATDPALPLEPGAYLALLSHSGSRGVGFQIANTYSKLAMEAHPRLDQSVRHLAWLSLDSETGQEYWLSMELAGRFASANHAVIHHRVADMVGLKEIAVVENHHNYSWKERYIDPQGIVHEVIVHRKGATPAGPGVLGVIPGSMGDTGFVVRGRGVPASLSSASHGAGRAMSRRAALDRIAKRERDEYLRERGVVLLGGGIDESPQAYKRIEDVIAAQADLVDIVGTFAPRIVRMAEEPGDI